MGKMNLDEPHPVVMALPPEMLMKELRVATTAATDDLTPASGKRIRVLGWFASQYVAHTTTVTTTLRATLAFGTDHTTEVDKILIGYRQSDPYDDAGAPMCGINVLGAVDEKVRLTNVTYTGGGEIISRAVVYYREE